MGEQGMGDRETRAQQVEREDVLAFFDAALAGTGQAEFYEGAAEQALGLDFLHTYVQVNYRRLYARALALVRGSGGLNHHNALRIVGGLLRAGAPTDAEQRAEENALIRSALRRVQPQRVLKFFRQLVKDRVNNRRTRATVRAWLEQRKDQTFDIVKYRSKYRKIAVHAHLKIRGEAGTFLFRRWTTFQAPLFEAVRQARYSKEKVYALPYTVAEGWAAFHGIPRAQFLKRFLDREDAQITEGERRRLMRSAEAAGADTEADLSAMPLTALCLYALSLPVAARRAGAQEAGGAGATGGEKVRSKRAELVAALDAAADRAAIGGLVGPVAAVLDRSWSSSGSAEKRRRPLAVAMGIGWIVRRLGGQVYLSTPVEGGDLLSLSPYGATSIAQPLIDALDGPSPPRTVLIVSDGFENEPPGATHEIVRLYRQHLDPVGADGAVKTRILHLNPVLSAADLRPRPLSPLVPTVAIRDAEDLAFSLALATFAEGRPLQELDRHLDDLVRRSIG